MAGIVAPGVAVMLLDPGFVSTLKEMNAMIQTLLGAEQRYPGIELIKSIGTKSKQVEQKAIDPKTPIDAQIQTTLDSVKEALRVIDAKATPEETKAYRQLCLEVAKSAAEASGNGIFGIGRKLSDNEKAYITRLEALLG
jgi:hypothetical protein